MNIKYLLGSFLVLLVAASAMTPVLGASNTQNNSDTQAISITLHGDLNHWEPDWENMTDAEKEAYVGQATLVSEDGSISYSIRVAAVDSIDFLKISMSEYTEEEMRLLESMNAEEREAYFLDKFQGYLDSEVEAGNLTREEADQMYADYETIEPAEVTVISSAFNFQALAQEEIEALKDMTEDEKEAYLSEHFRASLDAAVANGSLTQEEADEIALSRQTGVLLTIEGNPMRSAQLMAPLSEEELSTLQNMTADDRQEFLLSQIKSNLDADVAAGRMTQEEADEIYAYHALGSESYLDGDTIYATIVATPSEPIIAE